MSQELRHGILIIDYGNPYTLTLAREIRSHGTYTEIWAANDSRLQDIISTKETVARALILSGGHQRLEIDNPPPLVGGLLDLDIPILAVGSCMQRVVEAYGGKISDAAELEHVERDVRVKGVCELFSGFSAGGNLSVWMPDHRPVQTLAPHLRTIAEDQEGQCIAFTHADKKIYGVFFQPLAPIQGRGEDVLWNFVDDIVGVEHEWNMGAFIERSIHSIREQVGNARVICALSGGVDSSVVAALLARAIGKQLTCIFVDTGVMRMNERQKVEKMVHDHFHVDLRAVDESDRFLDMLQDVRDPEAKRKIIGEQFIRVFEDIARDIPDARFLAQGTLYPDVVESVKLKGEEVAVKSHHNVGGLPEDLQFELIEPLRELFKDEVRELGRQLGLPDEVVERHPFPGPGLSVRIVGEVTRERVETVRHADDIFITMLRERGLYRSTWQAFVVLIPVKTVGVSDGKRTYEWVCSLRAINSSDGMMATPTAFSHDFLLDVSTAIIEQVPKINRVVYDISPKPPATIEWE